MCETIVTMCKQLPKTKHQKNKEGERKNHNIWKDSGKVQVWNRQCQNEQRSRIISTHAWCFNVEEWLNSSCNFDQPLFNIESTIGFQRWNLNHIIINVVFTLKTQLSSLTLKATLKQRFNTWNFICIVFVPCITN